MIILSVDLDLIWPRQKSEGQEGKQGRNETFLRDGFKTSFTFIMLRINTLQYEDSLYAYLSLESLNNQYHTTPQG